MQYGGVVYMMTNLTHQVIYVGVSSDLISRVQEHKNGIFQNGFTARYNCKKLVYYNSFPTIEEAILEEKRIKGGSRVKKEVLIESINPNWKDLWEDIKTW